MKRVGEKVIFKTKFFTIKDIHLQPEVGREVTYQIMEKANSAMIVPITKQGNLILVKEYLYAIDEYQIGLPKGMIDPGDEPRKTANKELQEEIGYKAVSLEDLGVLTMSPGYLTQRTHMFLARDLKESHLSGDELEKLEVLEYPFEKFEELIQEGKITDARMIAALYLAKRFLQKAQ